MSFRKILFLLLYVLPCVSFGQSGSLSCADIKDGIFYFYPKNSADNFIEKRENEWLTEINERNNDTALWQINWINDCTYSLKFISSNNNTIEKQAKALKKHKLVYEITVLTDDYYVFKGYIDNTTNLPIQYDTIWLNKKTSLINTGLFEELHDSTSFNKPLINDTSKYAILYIYREKNIFLMLSNYLIYFDDNPLCIAKNNSGFIFKILKEGDVQLKSRLYKDASSINMDVQFGKVYYVRSTIHWAITNKLYNFKLGMALIDPEQGQKDFERVKVK